MFTYLLYCQGIISVTFHYFASTLSHLFLPLAGVLTGNDKTEISYSHGPDYEGCYLVGSDAV
jgi:hypothetical protein